ncbi:hypothetical protein LOTGIDRAFT_168909 [Lottia gigantea]|uniref:Gfo/Idh/MocA-like oxidoreductase N-terminal domain-containing protein n=1 Tax=Lottia gigantea TaxID=225164 RepID=V3ZSL0_LOTGI|nr:hypothetical protein LOTGIDRAFT_168909 [Lottia gigantea]ESO83866.1 hypothetical protein LOTGIDRAFT_168909 [Lottia gigantea]
MKSRLGIALIGMGRMGLIHLKNCMMSPRTDVKWVIRNNIVEAEKYLMNYNLPIKYTSPDRYTDVLNDPSVDAVIIASSTDTHEDFINRSLQAGKHIFCEKPITSNIDTTKQCYDLAEKFDKHLFCAFHRRFDPSLKILKDKLDRKVLGDPRLVKISSHDVTAPPIDYYRNNKGGILTDSTIHDLDLVRWLINSNPASINISETSFNPEVAKYDSELVLVTIKFKNGAMCVIDNGRQATFGYDQRTEVLCDKGVLKVRNKSANLFTMSTSDKSTVSGIDLCFTQRYAQAYQNELEHFLDVLQGKCRLEVNKEDILEVYKLIEAGRRSIDLKTPVNLNTD